MTPGLIDESALPTVTPTIGAVSDGATALRSSTAQVEHDATAAQDSWSGIGAALSSPGATDALPDAVHGAVHTAAGLAKAASAVATALDTFAIDVAAIRKTRRSLVADVEELRNRVGASDSDDAVPAEYQAANDDLHARAARLRTRWTTAQDELSHEIRGQVGGTPRLFPSLSGNTLAAPFAMVDFAEAARAFGDAATLPLLTALAAEGPDALRKWAVAHPARAQRMLDHPPATADVKQWWSGLGADERDALVTGLSTVIGNLNGVLYADRGRANQHTLETALRKALADRIEMQGRVTRGGPLSAAERARYQALIERIEALQTLARTLGASVPAAPRTIVSLTLGDPPLAAVAIGDLDIATNVTVTVPGMGNTVAESMQGWTGGAENLYTEQRRIADDPSVATIAWMGYDTPEMPPSPDVLRSTKALKGAENLSTFLRGISGTRGWQGGSHLSVVAHSYGTTTATLAAAKTPVDNLTLLASAGIDDRLPDVHALAVPDGHVWASQAKDDLIANIGRGSVEIPRPMFGGDQPINTGNPLTSNRTLVMSLWSTHTLNPSERDWGARTFSSNEEETGGVTRPGSDGHGATPATEAVINGEPITSRGYLDAGTSSLYNTARTSLGYTPNGQRIP
ncbi:alpha/beta hydrolase family protein [Curtobacterium flaccumfaciens]|uniref:Alpha/beta hydrolase family protein n=1 Tax=Curtobacterium flaccumfaciens TaxID=2035 RepID=A0A4R6DCM2_9MICO|nr:alpha/beta hydrolase [Curtobacterium flaccumfaciens]TDN42251.1 alpha/beta hydrolase family protein [Curtobacterium flaccumfaciens]